MGNTAINLSVELPEAYILAEQMSRKLIGKTVANCTLQGCGKFQKLGFVNIYASDFQQLCGRKVQSVVLRGNVIRMQLDGGLNLLLAPEYGGKITYQLADATAPNRFHLQVGFSDHSTLTVTLTGMGIIQTLTDQTLESSYVYRRDFSTVPSPLNKAEFGLVRFSEDLAKRHVNIKTALVGKDAVVVGLANSAFQDVIFRAGIHPKRKASELDENEKTALYGAIKHVIQERIRLGGKTTFVDLYGKQGNYSPAMGPNMKGEHCLACGGEVQRLSLGGGQSYFCPRCQH